MWSHSQLFIFYHPNLNVLHFSNKITFFWNVTPCILAPISKPHVVTSHRNIILIPQRKRNIAQLSIKHTWKQVVNFAPIGTCFFSMGSMFSLTGHEWNTARRLFHEKKKTTHTHIRRKTNFIRMNNVSLKAYPNTVETQANKRSCLFWYSGSRNCPRRLEISMSCLHFLTTIPTAKFHEYLFTWNGVEKKTVRQSDSVPPQGMHALLGPVPNDRLISELTFCFPF
jgi:hypothetical protein